MLPVDDNTTKVILFSVVFLILVWTAYLKYYTKIYAEDSLVSESHILELYLLTCQPKFILLDALQLAYRKLHQKYVAMAGV